MNRYEVVVPVIPQDFIRCKMNYILMEKHLSIKYLLGQRNLKQK